MAQNPPTTGPAPTCEPLNYRDTVVMSNSEEASQSVSERPDLQLVVVVVQEYQHGDKRDESLEDTGRFEGVQEKGDDVSLLAFKGRHAAVESEGIVHQREQEDEAREGVGGGAGSGQGDGLGRGQSAQVGVVVYLLLDAQQYAGVPLVQAGDAVVLLHGVGEALHVLVLQVLRQDLQVNTL